MSIGALVDPRGAWRLESGALWSSAWRLAAPHAGRNGGAQIRSGFAVLFGDSLDLDVVVGEEAPRATQALVVAQDVYLILGEATATDEAEVVRTPAQVLSEALRQRPRRRGTVLAGPEQPGRPLLLQAIVYDFEESPPTRESYVFEALVSAFETAAGRGVSALALHPLGTAHAGIEPERFLALLTQVCFSAAELGTALRHVHLLVSSPAELETYERLLRALAGGRVRGRRPR